MPRTSETPIPQQSGAKSPINVARCVVIAELMKTSSVFLSCGFRDRFRPLRLFVIPEHERESAAA